MMNLRVAVFLAMGGTTLLSSPAVADPSNTDVASLVPELKAYGECIDEQNAIEAIRSMPALNAANGQCDDFISRIRDISPQVAAMLMKHMRKKVFDLNRDVDTESLPSTPIFTATRRIDDD